MFTYFTYLSINLLICLSLYLSTFSSCLSVPHLSASLFVKSCLLFYLSLLLSVYLSVFLSKHFFCFPVPPSICLSVYLSLILSNFFFCFTSLSLSPCLSVYLTICLSFCQNFYFVLPVCPSLFLPVFCSICLSVSLFVKSFLLFHQVGNIKPKCSLSLFNVHKGKSGLY